MEPTHEAQQIMMDYSHLMKEGVSEDQIVDLLALAYSLFHDCLFRDDEEDDNGCH